ncbi:MAG: hypothetical protein KAG34_12645, partial [Cocleimonas sp.]|nr:hypothetical protein [Cocleimonas sp.]
TRDDEIMLITSGGILVRTPVENISVSSRNTQGVTLIKLGKGESLVQVAPIENMMGDEGVDGEEEAENSDNQDDTKE